MPVALGCEVRAGWRADRRREIHAGAVAATGRGAFRGRSEGPGLPLLLGSACGRSSGGAGPGARAERRQSCRRARREDLSEAQLARLERVGTWSAGHGWSWQQPALRAIERDDDAIEVWRKEIWPRVRAPRRSGGPGSSSRTRPGSR
ncbi:winged helix-turn-helix domain-containing protein [Streptomyces sp. NPDC051287]|uniref:winged helix-turn-helix domain-containing protein n=1 Tax=Streptomyces sp. NPDC051287 TaxID=3365648 RepID=UPI0037A91D91